MVKSFNMGRVKRMFRCLNPSVQETPSFDVTRPKNSQVELEIEQSEKKKEYYVQFAAKYKQQHLVALAESQAIFEKQKQHIEKRLYDINEKINQVERLQALQGSQTIFENHNRDIEKRFQDIDNKLEIISKTQSQRIGDAEWVKFE